MTAASHSLSPLDCLSVDVITDDVSDNYVSKTLFAVSEFANIVRAGAKTLSGEALLCANLGFGCRLVSTARGVRRTLLFDTGPEGAIFLRNCANLGIALGEVEAIAVSHGHWDHMAALPATLRAIGEQGGKAAVHVNPGMFDERAIRLASGTIVPAAKVPSPAEMGALGAAIVNDPAARLLLDRHFYLSGEIPRLSAFEKGRTDHLSRTGSEAPWQPDPLLLDERMLVTHVRNLGLVVLSSCSHAGIVNVCTEVRRLFPDIPIHCVMGGLHLGGVMERIIPETIEGLRPFAIANIITGHCTGWRALHALANAFGDAVSQSAVGTTYAFAA
ncbi:MAG TPA: MBL fold metallo-hydrolase [Stellaceae bacterium]|jgi:7,8-dihydropterin-6-yl-methyl-4-(beta-D-ribofuranosyl)aminobenzene 5'-phosphate synthase